MNLTYRKMNSGDASLFFEMVDCPLIQELTLFQMAKSKSETPSHIFNMLVKENKEPVFHSFIVFQDDTPVAFLNRVMTDQKLGYLIVGGWVDKNHRGQSIFGQALKMLIADLEKEYPSHKFSATVRENNVPSLKTLEKIGFHEVDRTNDNPSKISFVYP